MKENRWFAICCRVARMRGRYVIVLPFSLGKRLYRRRYILLEINPEDMDILRFKSRGKEEESDGERV